MKSRKAILISVVSAVCLGAIAVLLLNRDSTAARPMPESGSADPFQRPYFSENGGGGDDVDPAQVLNDYKEWSQFPPFSRPLNESMIDIIDQDHIPLPYRPALYTDDKNDTRQGAYACVLQPHSHNVVEGQSQLLFLSCHRGDPVKPPEQGSFTALRISDISLFKVGYRDMERLPSVAIAENDSGRDGDEAAGDNTHTIRFTPSRSDWGHMRITVRFKIPEDSFNREYNIEAQFFSSPTAPAYFTGKFTDEVREGSLIVNVELRVVRPGKYHVQANLKNQHQYLAVAREEIELRSGIQTVPLLFFGRIFHAKEAPGPYQLTGLHGYRDNNFISSEILDSPDSAKKLEELAKSIESGRASIEPEKEIVPPFSDAYSTRQYRISDFLSDEYDSQRKRTEINALTKLASEMQ